MLQRFGREPVQYRLHPATSPHIACRLPRSAVTDRPDPYRSVSRDLLAVLADAGRPMSLCDLEADDRLGGPDAARSKLSVARVAGFVRSLPGGAHGLEPAYQPTALGHMIARRSHTFATAQRERSRPAPPTAV